MSGRRATVLKMFMISLISMGILAGVYSADTLRPIIWTIWTSFVVTASAFMIMVRTDLKNKNSEHS